MFLRYLTVSTTAFDIRIHVSFELPRKVTVYRQIRLLVVTRCNVVGIYINAEKRTPSYSSSETSVYYASLTRRHVPEGHKLIWHPHVHLKSHKLHSKLAQDIHSRALN